MLGATSSDELEALRRLQAAAAGKAAAIIAWRYTSFAGLSLVVWDYILTFSGEVVYFWRARRSWPTIFFFLNRYIPILVLSFNAVAQTIAPPNDLFCKVWLAGVLTWGAAIQIVSCHSILAFRLCALYGNRWKIKIALSLFFIMTGVGFLSVMGYHTASLRITSTPLPRLLPTLRLCYSPVSPNLTWALAPMFLFEIVVFSALSYKVIRQLQKDHGSSGLSFHCHRTCPDCASEQRDCKVKRAQNTLLHVILRDNLIYFPIVMVLLVGEACLWSTLPTPEREMLDFPTVALLSILTNRMLINVRKQGERNRLAISVGTLTAAAEEMLSDYDRATAAAMALPLSKKDLSEPIPMQLAQKSWDSRSRSKGTVDDAPLSGCPPKQGSEESLPGQQPGAASAGHQEQLPAANPTSGIASVFSNFRSSKTTSNSSGRGTSRQTISAPAVYGGGAVASTSKSETRHIWSLTRSVSNSPATSRKGKAPLYEVGADTAWGDETRISQRGRAEEPYQHILARSLSERGKLRSPPTREYPPSPALSSPVTDCRDQLLQQPSSPHSPMDELLRAAGLEPQTEDGDPFVDGEATSTYPASMSSRKGPRPRTPSNASSDATMPWHVPTFTTFEEQKQLPPEAV